jgi:hypothetical protein
VGKDEKEGGALGGGHTSMVIIFFTGNVIFRWVSCSIDHPSIQSNETHQSNNNRMYGVSARHQFENQPQGYVAVGNITKVNKNRHQRGKQ